MREEGDEMKTTAIDELAASKTFLAGLRGNQIYASERLVHVYHHHYHDKLLAEKHLCSKIV